MGGEKGRESACAWGSRRFFLLLESETSKKTHTFDDPTIAVHTIPIVTPQIPPHLPKKIPNFNNMSTFMMSTYGTDGPLKLVHRGVHRLLENSRGQPCFHSMHETKPLVAADTAEIGGWCFLVGDETTLWHVESSNADGMIRLRPWDQTIGRTGGECANCKWVNREDVVPLCVS